MPAQNPDMEPLLEIEEVCKYFPVKKGFLQRHVGDVKALDGVSFTVNRGETVGLVGESGCGKTTLGRVVAGAHKATSGGVRFNNPDGDPVDVGTLRGDQLNNYLTHVQMVFQDPYSSLNPRRTVMQIIEEPLICLTEFSPKKRRARVFELLEVVGLNRRHAERYPHAFSGGQRQRIGIARALAVDPSLLVCDESVSALDVSVQGQIINLLMKLRAERGLSYLFISHDLAVVRHISDRIAVMYVGKLVEWAPAKEIFTSPRHPYTEALLSAVLRPDPGHPLDAMVLEGDVADPANRPSGCSFHPRCRYAQDICRTDEPPMAAMNNDGQERLAACHFAKELKLSGIDDDPAKQPEKMLRSEPQ
ncbi:MAG: ABC transporter ATP-binding protein [Hyphomicrobiales bacterium]|jgi:peptide/nickel transport system ATP-binding protein